MSKVIEKTLDDRLLIARAKRGDERAFTALVNRYEDLVYSFALKICRDREKAEETLQDTFVNIFQKLRQFRGKSKFTTWLYRIATNNCLMKWRRSKRSESTIFIEEPAGFDEGIRDGHTETQAQTIPSWKDSPLQRVMTVELRQLLDEAIQRLPLDYRVVFILRDVEGESTQETAKILKLSVPAVKSRLRRARVFLRDQLNEYMTS